MTMFSIDQLVYKEPVANTAWCTAGLSRYPTTPDQHIVILHRDNLFNVVDQQFVEMMSFVQKYAEMVKRSSGVRRCGLAYDGFRHIHIIPMHGLSPDWSPLRADETPFRSSYQGYLWTKSSPHMSNDELEKIQTKLTAVSGWHTPNTMFMGAEGSGNLFAKLIRGEIPQWRIWEDNNHLAFLTPFANTPAYTVLIPRKHLPSDILGLSDQDFQDLSQAIKKVAAILMSGMKIARVGLFFEGYEIDYAHAKLVPVLDDTVGIEGPSNEYRTTYSGHITTRLGPARSDGLLSESYKALQDYLGNNPFLISGR